MASPRRLAAILLADLAGYSRLMQADEQRVHDCLMAHRRELVDPKIQEHYGRVVKYTGDGFLAEFPSVIEAVLCAVEVQCGMHHRNLAVAAEQRMRFRIGINLGDVIAEPEDIYGDGVNIAARLEAMAEPSGICISHVVHEQVRDKLPFEFVDLGPRASQEHRTPAACLRARRRRNRGAAAAGRRDTAAADRGRAGDARPTALDRRAALS